MHYIDRLTLALDQALCSVRKIQFTNDLLPAQWVVLRYLSNANKNSLTPGFVAKFLGTTNGTASQTLHSLEKKGYICRLQSKADKRVVNLSLTKAGKEILKTDPVRKLLIQMDRAHKSDSNLLKGLDSLISQLKPNKTNTQFGFCKYCENFHKCKDETDCLAGYCILKHEPISSKDALKICANFVQLPTSDDVSIPKGTSLAPK